MDRNYWKNLLPVIQAFAEGKPVELFDGDKWTEEEALSFILVPDCYRIKPEPTMVVLGPDDVPPGSVIRNAIADIGWMAVVAVNFHDITVVLPGGNTRNCTWEVLKNSAVIKRPGEDWTPCHKPATTQNS